MGLLSGLGAVVGSIIAPGIGTAIGGALGGAGDYMLNKHDSRDAASRQNQYQLYMSNSAHQREVADLRAAGLNPVLSALGSGASVMSVPVNGSYNSDNVDARSALESQRRQETAVANATIGKLLQDAATGSALERQSYEVTRTERSKQAQNAAQARLLDAQAVTEATKQLQGLASARFMDEQAKTQATLRDLNVANTALAIANRGLTSEREALTRGQKQWNFYNYLRDRRREDFMSEMRRKDPMHYQQLIRTEMFGSTPLQLMLNSVMPAFTGGEK